MSRKNEFPNPRERRARRRFHIEQDLSYTCLSGAAQTGVGKVLNISSKGIYFTTESAVQPGTRVELAVNWPALLDHSCGMKLMIFGSVVRSEPHSAAARIEQYEFRTRPLRSMPALVEAPPKTRKA